MYVHLCIYLSIHEYKSIQGTKNPKNSQKDSSYENCPHFWDICERYLKKIYKKKFKLCSYIQTNTTNPNTIFKITIYCTKYTKNAKIHSNNTNVRKN